MIFPQYIPKKIFLEYPSQTIPRIAGLQLPPSRPNEFLDTTGQSG
jgi:hypothetical protein